MNTFWGESACQATYNTGAKLPCRELARYKQPNGVFCGIHSNKKTRSVLPKNPNAANVKVALLKQRIEAAHTFAKTQNHGTLTATKLCMMREPTPRPGYLPIFPNNKHAHGFGYGIGDFSELSPMRLGQVIVNGLVVAQNIENYHQFSKVFPQETGTEPCNCGRTWPHNKPNAAFYMTRMNGYMDTIPHRHKFPAKDIQKINKKYVTGTIGVNKPMYSIQIANNGQEYHYTYLESRYFYCYQMEQLATKTKAFATLKRYYADNYAIEIFGYDAYTPPGTDANSLYECYCDASRPFGHEMVILTLLAIPDPKELPWHRYARNPDVETRLKTDHKNIYEAFLPEHSNV